MMFSCAMSAHSLLLRSSKGEPIADFGF